MEDKLSNFRCGFVAILGRPNVGKSTLLNALLGNKISVVSSIPQTTRHQIRGILNLDSAQVIFVDTPGIHSFRDELAQHLNKVAKKSVEDIELILYVVDVTRSVGREEKTIMSFILSSNINVVMALNKIDLGTDFLNQYIETWENFVKEKGVSNPVKFYIPVSAKTGKNVDKLKEVIVELLPQQPPFYSSGEVTDFPLKFRVADVIREKLFSYLKEELPYSCAVNVEDIEDRKNLVYIKAYIYVNRDSQKKIVIGKDGSFIKKIGTESRKELEIIFGKKVFLDLEVKVIKEWQESTRILKELGYWWA